MSLLDPLFNLIGVVTWPLAGRKYIDDTHNIVVADTALLQDEYFQKYGKYWQGIETPSILPSNGAKQNSDLNLKPTDQEQSWDTFYKLDTQLPCSVRIDTYTCLQGHGYTVTTTASYGGKLFQKCTNFGFESEREFDWIEIKTD